jgi:hypothetical protein
MQATLVVRCKAQGYGSMARLPGAKKARQAAVCQWHLNTSIQVPTTPFCMDWLDPAVTGSRAQIRLICGAVYTARASPHLCRTCLPAVFSP